MHLRQVKKAYVPTQCLLLPVFDLLKTKWYGLVAWSQCFGKRLLIRGQPPIDPLYSRYWQSREQLKMEKSQNAKYVYYYWIVFLYLKSTWVHICSMFKKSYYWWGSKIAIKKWKSWHFAASLSSKFQGVSFFNNFLFGTKRTITSDVHIVRKLNLIVQIMCKYLKTAFNFT